MTDGTQTIRDRIGKEPGTFISSNGQVYRLGLSSFKTENGVATTSLEIRFKADSPGIFTIYSNNIMIGGIEDHFYDKGDFYIRLNVQTDPKNSGMELLKKMSIAFTALEEASDLDFSVVPIDAFHSKIVFLGKYPEGEEISIYHSNGMIERYLLNSNEVRIMYRERARFCFRIGRKLYWVEV